MGYTHYWHCEGVNEEDRRGFKAGIPVFRDILERHKDLVQREYDRAEPALLDEEGTRIIFNGIDDDGFETFMFSLDKDFQFCKTNRRRYDVVVCEMLLALQHFCPHVSFTSDGINGGIPDGDSAWREALQVMWERHKISMTSGLASEVAREVTLDKYGFILRIGVNGSGCIISKGFPPSVVGCSTEEELDDYGVGVMDALSSFLLALECNGVHVNTPEFENALTTTFDAVMNNA